MASAANTLSKLTQISVTGRYDAADIWIKSGCSIMELHKFLGDNTAVALHGISSLSQRVKRCRVAVGVIQLMADRAWHVYRAGLPGLQEHWKTMSTGIFI